MSAKSLFTKGLLATGVAAILTAPVITAAAASAAPVPPRPTEIVLKDGRGLDAQTTMKWQYDQRLHRWVRAEVLTGKVLVDRNQGEGYWGDRNGSEHFQFVYGPAGRLAFIQYTGPGALHNWYVQTSDQKAPGIPAWANYGYLGSKLVPSTMGATVFTVLPAGPLGYRTLTVPAGAFPRVHGPEILTGEIYGQLGLNAQGRALPTAAQLFVQR